MKLPLDEIRQIEREVALSILTENQKEKDIQFKKLVDSSIRDSQESIEDIRDRLENRDIDLDQISEFLDKAEEKLSKLSTEAIKLISRSGFLSQIDFVRNRKKSNVLSQIYGIENLTESVKGYIYRLEKSILKFFTIKSLNALVSENEDSVLNDFKSNKDYAEKLNSFKQDSIATLRNVEKYRDKTKISYKTDELGYSSPFFVEDICENVPIKNLVKLENYSKQSSTTPTSSALHDRVEEYFEDEEIRIEFDKRHKKNLVQYSFDELKKRWESNKIKSKDALNIIIKTLKLKVD